MISVSMETFPSDHPYTGPYLAYWLKAGHANPWIAAASDPPFSAQRFTAFDTDEDALAFILHGNWALGEAA